MLIIKRQTGHSIRIGSETVVTILGASDDGVRIGIDAPKDLRILREEIATPNHRTNKREEGHEVPRRGHTGLYRRGRIHRNPG